jgi:succinyldiaminopimelate transaminase
MRSFSRLCRRSSTITDAPDPLVTPTVRRVADGLPDFPWDVLAPYAERARAHPGGIVDMSVGTPVDPTPDVIQAALRDAANAPGYPTAAGRPELRAAALDWMRRTLGVDAADAGVVPAIGTKEMVAWLPTLLGLGAGARVVIPRVAYPTYEVGARLAGCEVVATDTPEEVDDAALVWLNSPSNPTGSVLSAERMAQVVSWARERGAVVASDECYITLGWQAQATSVLHPSVSGGRLDGLFALHSLSKRSNLAGYRYGFLAGDPRLAADVLAVRKHAGMMVPLPIQAAAIAGLLDDQHAAEQRARYARRRDVLMEALTSHGFRIDHSEAGLYLWATRGEDAWQTVSWLADRGILVAPGTFYGSAGDRHVRVALTATDERVEQVPERLSV